MALASRPIPARPAPARTLGSAPAPKSPVPKEDLVNTATLLRGRVYFYKDQEFKLGEPSIVTDQIADVLEELHHEVKDKDGEIYEKPFFDVRRGVPRPPPKVAPKKSVRRLKASVE